MRRSIDEHRGRFGVEPICKTSDVSAPAYCQRATGARSARQVEDERLLQVIRQTHAANDVAYGYRRTWKAMLRVGDSVAGLPSLTVHPWHLVVSVPERPEGPMNARLKQLRLIES